VTFEFEIGEENDEHVDLHQQTAAPLRKLEEQHYANNQTDGCKVHIQYMDSQNIFPKKRAAKEAVVVETREPEPRKSESSGGKRPVRTSSLLHSARRRIIN
jgi:hypothetical protein